MGVVLKRDDFGFPSFWQLQAAGSAAFWLLVLLSLLPYKNREEFLHETIFCATVSLVSCFLRPVCRSLCRRSLSWFALELYAFAWSAALGVVATFISEVVKLRAVRPIWPDFLENWLSFLVVFFLWCTLYFNIKQWQQGAREREQLAREREKLAQAESEAREARLSSLRYQLNPHFLFNSLNAVSTLVLAGKASAATRMLGQIGELLRTTLDSNALPEVPLSQEITVIQQYLAIEQTRLGNRLRIEMRVSPDTLDATVPTMLLQPLVENAVRHGVAPAVEGGTIVIESAIRVDRLRLTITNSVPGTETLSVPIAKASKGIGLANTGERLKVLYGNDHRFELHSSEEGDWQVTIEIPLWKTISHAEGVLCAH